MLEYLDMANSLITTITITKDNRTSYK